MIEELVACFDRTLVFMRQLVADLPDEEMVLQPPGVPNHAAWTLGHVIHSCEAMAAELGTGPWLARDWESFFGYGTTPSNVASSPYSGKAALLASLTEAADRLRVALRGIDACRFKAPLPDETARQVLPTIGDALLQILCAHTAYHAGQLAVWRRAIGREPVGVFV